MLWWKTILTFSIGPSQYLLVPPSPIEVLSTLGDLLPPFPRDLYVGSATFEDKELVPYIQMAFKQGLFPETMFPKESKMTMMQMFGTITNRNKHLDSTYIESINWREGAIRRLAYSAVPTDDEPAF